jgi:hypothetical protein
MSIQNLYLKQISCLQSPVNNQGWDEIAHYSPTLLQILVEVEDRGPEDSDSTHVVDKHHSVSNQQEPNDSPIPWYTGRITSQVDNVKEIIQLKRFIYDCSYTSPFIRNIYSR